MGAPIYVQDEYEGFLFVEGSLREPPSSREVEVLKTRGVPTKLVVYPGQNHELDVPSYLVHRMRANIEWFDRWLK